VTGQALNRTIPMMKSGHRTQCRKSCLFRKVWNYRCFFITGQKQFLQIVEGLVAKRGINIDKDTLQREAMKWELMYNGRSARTARQFVDWLEGSMKLKK